ncbi:hypothetical protein GCM10027052_03810 [Parafrigoribacterium mesophilum]|uniref:hypothetical protein n=1 Tax=Parafrigoribacterium mesophilum TaxID=433646 RepID=UPI0031FD98DC
MIDWAAFGLVAAVSLVGATLLVGFASLGIRLLGGAAPHSLGVRVGAFASFAVCVIGVAFGVYLLIPVFN